MTLPQHLYHWTEATAAPGLLADGFRIGDGHSGVYMTDCQRPGKDWAVSIGERLRRPTRLTIDTSRLDPDAFEGDHNAMQDHALNVSEEDWDEWERDPSPELSLDLTGCVHYLGPIPAEAVIASEEFPPDPRWTPEIYERLNAPPD